MASSVPQKKPNFYGGNLFEETRADPTVNEVCNFFLQHLVRRRDDHLEIEAKLGFLVDRSTGRRLSIGARNRVLFPSLEDLAATPDAPRLRFESRVGKEHFVRLNEMLNNRVVHTKARSGGPGGRPIPPVTYTKRNETDRFHTAAGGGVRVSVDDNGRVLRAVRKRRVSDVNLHCPFAAFDLRISASKEIPAEAPAGPCTKIRKKARISYRFDVWSFDITTVKTYTDLDAEGRPADEKRFDLSYEVEVELLEEYTAYVRHQFQLACENRPSVAPRIVQSLLSNLQSLSALSAAGARRPRLAEAPGPARGGGGGGHPAGAAKRPREDDADGDKAASKQRKAP